MKLVILLVVCAVAVATPTNVHKLEPLEALSTADIQTEQASRNILINTLIRQLIAYIRLVINNGSSIFGIPPLDPLDLDHFHLVVPAGLINLDLELQKIHVTGLGGFVVHTSNLNLRTMTFDLDISVPVFDIRCEEYDLIGDLFTAIPLYGKGSARFIAEGFRFQARLHLKQSDDQKSVLIESLEGATFVIPSLKSKLDGAIGGGDIDGIINAIIEEVILDYINRFQGAISHIAAEVVPATLNPILDKLDTWRYIAPLIPRV